VLLEAMGRLADRGDADAAELVLHGANLEHAPQEFQDRFHALLDDNAGTVRLHGRYRPQDLPSLMADVDWVVVPSIWYENAPLVIQEAFQHGKPVICSDIGGMAEAVTDGVDGLHFRAGSSVRWPTRCCAPRRPTGLWESLASGVRPVRSMEDHVRGAGGRVRDGPRPPSGAAALRPDPRACTGPPAALPAPTARGARSADR
jgi:hypothetical protein